jgi:UDP-N-acetyl-D-galactosamine dehydrogenase
VSIAPELPAGPFQAIVLAVRHAAITGLGRERLKAMLAPGGLIYDVTGVLPPGEADACI